APGRRPGQAARERRPAQEPGHQRRQAARADREERLRGRLRRQARVVHEPGAGELGDDPLLQAAALGNPGTRLPTGPRKRPVGNRPFHGRPEGDPMTRLEHPTAWRTLAPLALLFLAHRAAPADEMADRLSPVEAALKAGDRGRADRLSESL